MLSKDVLTKKFETLLSIAGLYGEEALISQDEIDWERISHIYDLASQTKGEYIFNGSYTIGHEVVAMLMANPNIKIFALDSDNVKYIDEAQSFLNAHYGRRVFLLRDEVAKLLNKSEGKGIGLFYIKDGNMLDKCYELSLEHNAGNTLVFVEEFFRPENFNRAQALIQQKKMQIIEPNRPCSYRVGHFSKIPETNFFSVNF